MRGSGVAEKYVRRVKYMYESCMTVVGWAVELKDGLKGEVGLHQRCNLSPFLFATMMDRLKADVRQESLLMMMFADDTVICNESREQVEKNL